MKPQRFELQSRMTTEADMYLLHLYVSKTGVMRYCYHNTAWRSEPGKPNRWPLLTAQAIRTNASLILDAALILATLLDAGVLVVDLYDYKTPPKEREPLSVSIDREHAIVKLESPPGYTVEYLARLRKWELKKGEGHCGLYTTFKEALISARHMEGLPV